LSMIPKLGLQALSCPDSPATEQGALNPKIVLLLAGCR
jgi:hypothetical protein